MTRLLNLPQTLLFQTRFMEIVLSETRIHEKLAQSTRLFIAEDNKNCLANVFLHSLRSIHFTPFISQVIPLREQATFRRHCDRRLYRQYCPSFISEVKLLAFVDGFRVLIRDPIQLRWIGELIFPVVINPEFLTCRAHKLRGKEERQMNGFVPITQPSGNTWQTINTPGLELFLPQSLTNRN